MITENKPWETIVTSHPGGAFSITRADEETRRKQFEEYKAKRIAELEAEIEKIKNLW